MDEVLTELYNAGKLNEVQAMLEKNWPDWREASPQFAQLGLLALYFSHRYEELIERIQSLPPGDLRNSVNSLYGVALWRLGRRQEAIKHGGSQGLSEMEARLENFRPKSFGDIERRQCRHCNANFPLRRGENCPGCGQSSGPRV